MALGVAPEGSTTTVQAPQKSYKGPLMLMVSLYFGIGFITALNDILIPHFKDLFHLQIKRHRIIFVYRQFSFH